MDSPSPSERTARPPRLAVLLLLFLLPLGLASRASVHGHGAGYVPDTHVVRNALGMAKDKNPVPPVGRYSTYPNLLPYMLLPIYAGYFAWGVVQEEWDGVQEFGDHVLLEPGGVHLLARLLVALLAALTPWVVYRTARAAGLGRGAFASGWLAATCLLLLQFATQERPWAPLALFIALTSWGAVVWLRDGRRRALVASGVAAGLAFATHQAGLGALGITGLAAIVGLVRPPAREGEEGAGAGFGARVASGLLALAAFLAVGFLVGHPYLLVHGRTATEAVVGGEQLAREGGLSIGGMSIQFDLRWESARRLVGVLVGYDPVLFVLGVLGLALTARRRVLLPVTIWTVGWGFFFLTNPSDHVRYLLPVLVLLTLPAGALIERLLERRGARPLVLLALSLPLAQAVRFAHVLALPDTRSEVGEALLELPLGSRVAIDRYGPALDLSQEALTRLKELRSEVGAGLYARERHRKNLLLQGELPLEEEGFDVVPIEDLFDFDERTREVRVKPGLANIGESPRAAFDALGVTHVLLVDRRPSAGHLLEPVVEESELVWELDPGSDDEPAPEAFLPLEMDFPLRALWAVERPGPRLRLYALPRGR